MMENLKVAEAKERRLMIIVYGTAVVVGIIAAFIAVYTGYAIITSN